MAGPEEAAAWEILPSDPEAEARLAEIFGFGVPLTRTLIARGLTEPSDIERFLTPSLERDWVSPELMPGMAECADRVVRAIEAGEAILVFGDFDVDGMTATSLLTLGLSKLGAKVTPFIPRRFDEGYGMSEAAVARARELADPSLIITVDTGIASGAEVERLVEAGVDVVVTDHHEPGDAVPKGVPLADPKLASGPGCHDLAGAGVALKLLQAVGDRLGEEHLWREYVDLAALGTVSDLMPLVGENRALVAAGIAALHAHPRPSIAAICAASNHDPQTIESEDLPFYVVPRLNAPGRMSSADLSLELLLEEDPERARLLAASIETINDERKKAEGLLADQAMELAERIFEPGDRSVVVGGEDWHEGVKGVCASRLVSRFGVPVVLFSVQGDVARGSGRSVGSVDLYHAVEAVSDTVLQFGGHEGAVGVTIATERLDEFAERLDAELQKLPASQFVSPTPVDALVEPRDLSIDVIDELDRLRPFGKANPVPLFLAEDVGFEDRQPVGRDGSHMRCWVTDGIQSFSAIRFRDPCIERTLAFDGVADVVYRPVVETWQGRTRAKLMIQDILFPPTVAELSDAESGEAEANAADGPASGAAERARMGSLPAERRREELARVFIGDAELLDAQRAALEALGEGRSAFTVMATGRGKSLIFQLHALEEAIAHDRQTIIVYPLRALVSDQSSAMGDRFASLGVGVATLTGESSPEERAATYEALGQGTVDVILTTPEYLALHAGDVARAGRVGFLVIDEAHHAGQSKGGSRAAYQHLPEIRAALGEPVCLGVTATAELEVAREACRLIGATELVLDDARRENLLVDDERDLIERDDAVAAIAKGGEKTLVYVSSRAGAVTLTRKLRHRLGEMGQAIAFYHAGLSRADRLRVEEAFRAGQVSCLVATSAFGEGVNLPDVRHVVLYHLPFDVTAFNQMSGRAGRDGEPAVIHLVFGAHDASINEQVLASGAPDRDALVALWQTLRALRRRIGPRLVGPLDALGVEVGHATGARPMPQAMVSAGLGIFEELGFLTLRPSSEGPVITLAERPSSADLETSIRYREGRRSLDAFDEFSDWVLRASATELRGRIIRPIVPEGLTL